MKTLRCLIADMPHKLLADILHRVTQQDEKIDVVGQVSGIDDVPSILSSEKIDVLIMGMRDDATHQFCRKILQRFPDLLVVGLVNDARMAVFCIAGLGSEQLVRLIRDIVNCQLDNIDCEAL